MISIYHMYWLLNLTKFVTHVPEVVMVVLFIFAYFRFHVAYHKSCIGCIWVRPFNDKFLQMMRFFSERFADVCGILFVVDFFSCALTVRPSKKGGRPTPKRKATFQLPTIKGWCCQVTNGSEPLGEAGNVSYTQFPQAFGRRNPPRRKALIPQGVWIFTSYKK